MTEVTSSAIRTVTYDKALRRLTVTFSSGRTYRYLDVPEAEYDAMLAAESKGAFFNDRIRDAYEFQFVA